MTIDYNSIYNSSKTKTKKYVSKTENYTTINNIIYNWLSDPTNNLNSILAIFIPKLILYDSTVKNELENSLNNILSDAYRNNKNCIIFKINSNNELKHNLNNMSSNELDNPHLKNLSKEKYIFKINNSKNIISFYDNIILNCKDAPKTTVTIDKLDSVIQDYTTYLKYKKLENDKFFEPKTTFTNHYDSVKTDPTLYKKIFYNTLRNKPEKYMHESLSDFLRDNLEANIIDESKQADNKRFDILIIVNINAHYLLEVKWLGDSIKASKTFDENNAFTTYNKFNIPEHIEQIYNYVKNYINREKISLRNANLVYFDARKNKTNIDYEKCLCEASLGDKQYLNYIDKPYIIPLENK